MRSGGQHDQENGWLRDTGGYIVDRLVGRYHQAVSGETFDVYFLRLKS